MMQPLTRLALDWAIRCFGKNHVYNHPLRSLRLAEEAIELAQACGIEQSKVMELVQIVYGRPRGMVDQELGGVAMTFAVMCAARQSDPSECLERELMRVLRLSPDHFSKRNEEKTDMGLVV